MSEEYNYNENHINENLTEMNKEYDKTDPFNDLTKPDDPGDVLYMEKDGWIERRPGTIEQKLVRRVDGTEEVIEHATPPSAIYHDGIHATRSNPEIPTHPDNNYDPTRPYQSDSIINQVNNERHEQKEYLENLQKLLESYDSYMSLLNYFGKNSIEEVLKDAAKYDVVNNVQQESVDPKPKI